MPEHPRPLRLADIERDLDRALGCPMIPGYEAMLRQVVHEHKSLVQANALLRELLHDTRTPRGNLEDWVRDYLATQEVENA